MRRIPSRRTGQSGPSAGFRIQTWVRKLTGAPPQLALSVAEKRLSPKQAARWTHYGRPVVRAFRFDTFVTRRKPTIAGTAGGFLRLKRFPGRRKSPQRPKEATLQPFNSLTRQRQLSALYLAEFPAVPL